MIRKIAKTEYSGEYVLHQSINEALLWLLRQAIAQTLPVNSVDAALLPVGAVISGDVAVAPEDEPPVADTPVVVSPVGP